MTSDILDRMPPCDLDAERAVLGSILLQPKILDNLASLLKASDFHSDAHQRLYRCLVGMSDQDKAIEPKLVTVELSRLGELEAVGGVAYIAEVLSSVGVASHYSYHAKLVIECAKRRNIIHAATEALRQAHATNVTVEECLNTAEESLAAIQCGSYDTDPVPMFDAVVEAMAEIDAILKRQKQAGIFTGLPDFDELYGGVFPGELTILAARPGQGKTSLALQMAAHAAQRHRVYFATLEMGRIELALKRLCSVSGVSSQKIRTGDLGELDRGSLVTASQSVANKNLLLHDWPEIRPYDIRRAARRFDAEVIFVDYLQYVSPPDAKKKRYEQVGDISRQLKTIARQMQVPVVACAQIGRQAEATRGEMRPRLSHLRESGNIENDCDVALLLWRPENPISAKDRPGEEWDAEVEIAKNRKGETGRLRLLWSGKRTSFSCYGNRVEAGIGGTEWTPDSF